MEDFKKRSKYFIAIIFIYIILGVFRDSIPHLNISISNYWSIILAALFGGAIYGAYRTHKGMHS